MSSEYIVVLKYNIYISIKKYLINATKFIQILFD